MAEDMEQAVETVRAAYDAWNRGEFDAAAGALHPEVEFHRVSDVETALSGADAVRRNWEPDVWGSQRVEVHRTEVIGERILVDTTFHAVGAGSGIELDQDGYHLWRIKDGKGVEFRFFLDREEAVRAAT
jgi:ketosteroid isomerase-like protein